MTVRKRVYDYAVLRDRFGSSQHGRSNIGLGIPLIRFDEIIEVREVLIVGGSKSQEQHRYRDQQESANEEVRPSGGLVDKKPERCDRTRDDRTDFGFNALETFALGISAVTREGVSTIPIDLGVGR